MWLEHFRYVEQHLRAFYGDSVFKQYIKSLHNIWSSKNDRENLKIVLEHLITLTHNQDFLDEVKYIQHFTTNPSWADVLDEFLIDPDYSKGSRVIYLSIGFSVSFVDDILFYPSKRPKNNMLKFMKSLTTNFKHHDNTLVFDRDIVLDMDDRIYPSSQLPVLRYQIGEFGGVSFINKEGIIKGSYYYYEPSSSYILI